jgi:hypothetical protein
MRVFLFALTVAVISWTQQSAFGVVLAYDGFDYANDAAPVVGLNGGTGWSSGWIDGGLGGGGFTVSQDDTSMSLSSFPFTPVGDRVLAVGAGTGGNSMRVARPLPSTFDMAQDGVLYASFLIKKVDSSTATTSNNIEFSLSAGTGGNGTIRFGSTSTNQFFINDGTSVPAAQNFGPITLGDTYFAVIKVQSFAATDDVVSALVFDSTETVPGAEPETWDKTKNFASIAVVDHVRLWIGVLASGEYDEIRVGTTWADVTSPATVLAGDYNSNGKVDGADYVYWRKHNGNDPGGYSLWRTNFGLPGGSGAGLGGSSAVPEPSVLVLFAIAIASAAGWRTRKS